MPSIRWFTVAAFVMSALFMPTAFAQYGGNKKPNPYGNKGTTPLSKGWLDKKNRSGDTTDTNDKKDPQANPTDQLATFVLGQRAKGTLKAKGSIADLEFRAPKNTLVSFTLAFVGKLGSSGISLVDAKGTPLENLKQVSRQFTLTDFKIPESGTYSLHIRHDGEGAISFAMTSSARYPEIIAQHLELTSKSAVSFQVPGFDDRAVRAISIVPADSEKPLGARIAVLDRNGEKIASLDGVALSPAKNIVPCPDEIALPLCEDYRFEIWLSDGGDARTVDLKLKLSKPALGSGTVELRLR